MLEEEGTPTSTEEETVEETTEETTEEETTEEVDWKAKAEKAEELAKNQKIRAEKAEKLAKEAKPKEEVQTDSLSPTDAILIAKSNIDVEDVERVIKFAKSEDLKIADALKNDELKAILEVRAEQRKTATATQTKSPRGTKSNSGEDYLAKAEKTGEIPDTDEGMRAMILAKQKAGRK